MKTFSPKVHNLKYRGVMRVNAFEPLSSGNKKLDKSVLIFNLLAVYSCPNCANCQKTCYAKKAQVQYPDVWNKRLYFTILALHQIDVLEELITAQLSRTKKKVVRIHESGDFISQPYLAMWDRIVRKFPDIKFYTYTKMEGILDFYWIKSRPNFNLVKSILPDGSINYGSEEYIEEKKKKYPTIPICPYKKGVTVKCGKDCTLCHHEKTVMFLQH